MVGKRDVIIKLSSKRDGAVVRVLADGTEKPYSIPEPDHARLDAMTDAELTEAAENDPDSPPLTDEHLDRMVLSRYLRQARARLGLSQEAFARRFRIPAASLRDWEQGRRMPDTATRAYLTVIVRDPNAVDRALAR
jgi:putative transcriptional regulator